MSKLNKLKSIVDEESNDSESLGIGFFTYSCNVYPVGIDLGY
jgi:hypothetical protein